MGEWATVGIRFALYADLMMLFGLPLFGLYALGRRSTLALLPFGPLVSLSAAAGIFLSIVALILLAASMSGVSPAEVDRASVEMLLNETVIGTAWQVRIAALFAALLFALSGRRGAAPLGGIAIAAAVALATLAWTGHGAASEGALGWVHLGADIVHLLASAAWLGALAGLLLLLRPAATMSRDHLYLSHRALAGFATAGTIMVGLIVLSGIVNGWILIGPDNIGALFTTVYGRLLLAKLLLFGFMLALAAANRFRLTPAFERALDGGKHVAAITALRRSLATETGAAILILLLVAWLGTLAPPASEM